MTDALTYAGETLDDALSRACAGLKARLGEIRYEVVREGGAEPGVEIAASIDPQAAIGLFLSELFRSGGLGLHVHLESSAGVLLGEIGGEDAGVLTGGGGHALDALQYLANRVLDRRLREHEPVRLDVSGFKARRGEELGRRAREAANQVSRSGRSVVFPLMTPAARREVHVALADDDRVTTESEGDGFLKRVVVRSRRRR